MKRIGYDWLLALLLAVLSWYLVTGRERVDTWVRVRIETAGLGEGLVLRGAPREFLDVLVRGPKGLVRKIDPSELVYTLDARTLTPGVNTVVIGPDAVPVSKLFDVVEVRPSRLELEVERRLSKAVPVRLAFRDGVQRDYKLTGTLEPAQVTVSGPESEVKGLEFVSIQPMTLPEEGSGRLDAPVSLVLPEQVEAQPRTVKVSLAYQLLMREAAVDAQVRVIRQGGHVANVSPDTVLLRFRAPVMLLREGAWRGLVDAFVEIPPGMAPGRHETTYRVTLPQGCELIQARPEKVTVLVK